MLPAMLVQNGSEEPEDKLQELWLEGEENDEAVIAPGVHSLAEFAACLWCCTAWHSPGMPGCVAARQHCKQAARDKLRLSL